MAALQIATYPYQLIGLHDFNARSPQSVRHGVLIRIEINPGQFGYADLHPWPELGDPDLATCLKQKNALWQRALHLAQMDGEARAHGHNLISQTLKSHRLVRDANHWPQGLEDDAVFKVKVSADLGSETLKLRKIIDQLYGIQKLRLDFNLSLQPKIFSNWLSDNSWLLKYVDFIEDPCQYDAEVWQRWRDLIAVDRMQVPLDQVVSVRVVKPVREDIESDGHFVRGLIRRIVFTHNMDHPLGQRTARACAQMFYEKHPRFLEPGGLESFDGYHLRDEALAQPQDQETGFGLDRYLRELSWQTV